ncbi:double-strand break repair helicase AddA [Mesorhizobium sp. L-8-3]|uniref:double-strand break repair helicase AddA n=1 Tax=Mesorhizobium sp. L-8-3 TaxID=2744522 RepID=UPI001928BAB7|nr:double-strand break repair helicase AddA [Mesorhizobium sp. L-8-3]BCH21361.1 double-strand break repair helicase AddA [Mesorhizobium sp. L-8-3]
MKKAYPIPQETAERQAIAADPRYSVWVSANAGSGKTHVLSQRVIRLLLEGTDPSKILCLTYTRAAAANMANRVFRDLAAWAVLDEASLAAQISKVEGRTPTRDRLLRARRLFAEALETPGGLKIQTIHAFCEAVLHQFPLEANIAGHFEMLDSQMEAALFAEARRDMISGAAGPQNESLAEAFATVLERGGEWGLDALLAEIVSKRDGLRKLIDQIGGNYAALFEEFEFDRHDTAAGVAADVWPLPGFSLEQYAEFREAAEAVDARKVLGAIVPNADRAFAEHDSVRRLALLAAGFLKTDGDPYDPVKTFKRALHDRLPDLADRYSAAAGAIVAARERLALFRMLEGTRAALVVADWLIARYEHLKNARGFLDFNDLIMRTVRLLARRDAGPWVQYKLDQGIDHILIDEAQDTSPHQWEVVRRLAEEFFAGYGSREGAHRTVFAVGDEKQSIYSFQGADPAAFAESGHAFSEKVRAAAGNFEQVRLTWSFRSTGDVLAAVDRVFERPDIRKGLTRDTEEIDHKAIRHNAPGYVEVWPPIGADTVEEPDDWTQPVDHASAPSVKVAENVARTIQGWLQRGERIEGTGKRLAPGDVMVLVRKRDRFVHALSRALKSRGIPVAGADRLSLPGHIAVKDLIALGRFVLQPEDDLSLAALLRSPIFGLSEDALFGLSWGRGKGVSLHASLLRAGREDPSFADVASRLDEWATAAAFRPVFEFYAGVLGRDGVRSRMIARLGHEAGDILDEFLNFCLAQERTGLPGLEAFLATLESAGPEIKREMDQTRDEVRIMTVHASKGLEAAVVFLVDSGSAAFSEQHLPRLMPFAPRNGIWQGDGYLWRASSDVANSFSRTAGALAREKAEEEYRRLLYVGMTRAEDRLIVCGYHGKRTPGPMTWLAIVSGALVGADEAEQHIEPATGQAVHRFRITPLSTTAATDAAVPRDREQTGAVLPQRLREPLPAAPALPRPLAPSGASALIEEERQAVISGRSPVLDAAAEPTFAIARGLAVHRLLQMLPSLPAAERLAAGGRYLDRIGRKWPAGEGEQALASVARILEDDQFAPIFAQGSRAEVSLMGTLSVRGAERAVSGKIDRLAVICETVLIADYKTNRPAPSTLAEVPPGYVAQLALYRALLAPIYPGKRIAAALVFTEAPRLIAVPEDVMDEALVRLTQA